MNNHLVDFPWFKEDKRLAKYRLLSTGFKKKKKGRLSVDISSLSNMYLITMMYYGSLL